MRTAISVINEIMMSRSTVEVLEAIEFFRVSRAFDLSGAEEGLRSMLLLINSKETGVKEAVVNAYKMIYLNTEHVDKYEAAVAVRDVHVLKPVGSAVALKLVITCQLFAFVGRGTTDSFAEKSNARAEARVERSY